LNGTAVSQLLPPETTADKWPFVSKSHLAERRQGHVNCGTALQQHREGVNKGWASILDRIRKRAEAK
jgi:hypothetical protein